MNKIKERIKKIRDKLSSGKVSLGTWNTLGHPAIAEIFSKSGFDWITIDLEHSVIDLFDAEQLIRTIDLSGSLPLCRLPVNDQTIIKRLLDAGAGGIIIPQVNSKKDLIKAVSATRYPSQGIRGAGLARAQEYGHSFDEYNDFLRSEGILIVAQIEHIDGVTNLDSILEVDELDAIIIGPYDLSASMGKAGQLNDLEVVQKIDQIISISKEKNISCGIHIIEPDLGKLDEAIEKGFNFIAYSLDIRMLDSSARDANKHINQK